MQLRVSDVSSTVHIRYAQITIGKWLTHSYFDILKIDASIVSGFSVLDSSFMDERPSLLSGIIVTPPLFCSSKHSESELESVSLECVDIDASDKDARSYSLSSSEAWPNWHRCDDCMT
jgi:hypothetical protein